MSVTPGAFNTARPAAGDAPVTSDSRAGRISGAPSRPRFALSRRTTPGPLLSSAGAMAAGTLLGAGTGVLFWSLAARTSDQHTLGQATTAVAVMTLVALVSGQPLAVTILRRLPPLLIRPVRLDVPAHSAAWPGAVPPARDPAAPVAVVAAAVCISAAAAVLLGGLAVLALPAVGLAGARDAGTGLVLVLAAATQAVGLVVDAAAVAARHGRLVVVRSACHGGGKLVALTALTLAAGAVAGPAAVLGTWALAGLASTVLALSRLRAALSANAEAVGRRRPPTGLRSVLAGAQVLRGGGAAQLTGILAASAAVQVLPILISAVSGPAAAGVFSLSWMVAGLLFMASTSLCSALLTTVAADLGGLRASVRQAVRWHALVLVPGVGVLALGAAGLLQLAGVHDAATGAPVLQVLAVSAVPNAAANCLVALLRAYERLAAVAISTCAGAVSTLLAAAVLTAGWGPTGTAAGWGAGQLVTTVVAAVFVLRTLRATRDHPRSGLSGSGSALARSVS